jgi:transposase
MAAVTQIRHAHSPGRAYFDRKIAEGKTGKEALRALKRQLSDAIYARLQADAARCGHGAPVEAEGPGGQSGNGSVSSAAGSHPGHRLFGQATPGPQPSLRPAATVRRVVQATASQTSRRSP